MNRKLLIALTLLALSPFAFTACGGDDSDDSTTEAATTESTTESTTDADADAGGSGGKGGSVEIAADASDLAYTTGELDTASGTVEIDFENPSGIGHDVRIEDSSGGDVGGTEVISESSTNAEVDLAPGTYTYYCSVDSHRQAGMEGTITVK